jgi:hypothetical protein
MKVKSYVSIHEAQETRSECVKTPGKKRLHKIYEKENEVKKRGKRITICASGIDTTDCILDLSDYKINLCKLYRLGLYDTGL